MLLRRVVRLAVPAVAETLFNSLIFLIDALMVAALGPVSLAATGLASVLLWRLRMNVGVLQISIGATVARRWGEGNHREARAVFSHGVVLGLLMGALCLPLIPLGSFIFSMMNARGELLEQVVPYFQVTLLCWPLRMATLNMAASFRAAGDTRTPMITTFIMNSANVVMNYALIFGHFGMPRLELFGAGVATALAVTLEFVMQLALGYRGLRMRRYDADERRPRHQFATFRFAANGWRFYRGKATRMIFRIAHASFWEEIAISAGFLIFFSMLAELGEAELAAQTAGLRLESFSFHVGYGISLAAATLVGQSLGALNIAAAKRIFSLSITLAFCTMGVVGIILASFPDELLALFSAEEEDRLFLSLARMALILTALEQPFIGSAQVLSAGLRGAGDTKSPFISQMLGNLGCRILLGYYLAFPLGLGLEGLVWATMADWIVRTAYMLWVLRRGKWAEQRV